MTLKSVFVFSSLVLIVISGSCQTNQSKNKKNRDINDELVKKVSLLEEFKLAEKQCDSFKKTTGIPFQLTIDVVGQSFYKEDSAKNIALAYITRNTEFEKRIIYTVKYDKDQNKIVSVEKNEKNLDDKKEGNIPPDIKL